MAVKLSWRHLANANTIAAAAAPVYMSTFMMTYKPSKLGQTVLCAGRLCI